MQYHVNKKRTTERKVSCRQPEMATAQRSPQKNSEEGPAAQEQKIKQRWILSQIDRTGQPKKNRPHHSFLAQIFIYHQCLGSCLNGRSHQLGPIRAYIQAVRASANSALLALIYRTIMDRGAPTFPQQNCLPLCYLKCYRCTIRWKLRWGLDQGVLQSYAKWRKSWCKSGNFLRSVLDRNAVELNRVESNTIGRVPGRAGQQWLTREGVLSQGKSSAHTQKVIILPPTHFYTQRFQSIDPQEARDVGLRIRWIQSAWCMHHFLLFDDLKQR